MPSITLVLGAGQIDRVVLNADDLLIQYRKDIGSVYINYHPTTPPDILVPEDIAVTLLVNSQVGWRAFRSLQEHGASFDLTELPQKPLEQTTPDDRRHLAVFIARLAQLPGFAASVATKVLHKKRPNLIPILDNQAIFGAYMNPHWPQQKGQSDSVRSLDRIRNALDWIAFDLTRPDNPQAWQALKAIEPSRSMIQLFDSVWWMHFRNTQPVQSIN